MPTRKHSKKNKKNKSLKFKAGGNPGAKEKEGVIDLIGNKISNATSSALSSLTDTGLKIVGLEKIDTQKKEIPTTNIVSNVSDIADKTSASLIKNINEVLGSDALNKTTEQVAKDTAIITTKLLNNFNEAINTPEVKQEVKEALNNAGEVASVAVDALKEPFSKVVDIAAESTQKATSAAVSGAIKVSTDALSAIPFWGAFIDLGKIMNDGSKAASAVVEAGTEALEVSSDAFIDTKKNFEKGLKELDKQKKMSKQILNRTTDSIDEFENPTIIKGGGKTKRRLFKKKLNTKRVRFAS